MRPEDRRLIKEKHEQLDALLPRMEADLWLVFCREGSDPSTLLLANSEMVGECAFVLTRDGRKHAVVADYDAEPIEAPGVFDSVTAYTTSGVAEPLRALVQGLKPETIALNVSLEDPLLDGLSYGMFLKLKRILEDDGLEARAVSSAGVLAPWRARKTPEELRRLKRAVHYTEAILDEVAGFMKSGMTEREVAEFIKERQRHYGVTASFGDGAAVMTGTAGMGHRPPGDARLTPGDVVVIDIGVFFEGYTSDIMRTFYLLDRGETAPPPEVQRRFEVARDAVRRAVAAMAPGKKGYEIDKVARDFLEANGIKAYTHALGHQIGRSVHDGGTTLAPLGARYGERGKAALVEGEVYTVEPVVHGRTGVDGVPIGPEQDVVVTASGAEFLSTPQETLVCIS